MKIWFHAVKSFIRSTGSGAEAAADLRMDRAQFFPGRSQGMRTTCRVPWGFLDLPRSVFTTTLSKQASSALHAQNLGKIRSLPKSTVPGWQGQRSDPGYPGPMAHTLPALGTTSKSLTHAQIQGLDGREEMGLGWEVRERAAVGWLL